MFAALLGVAGPARAAHRAPTSRSARARRRWAARSPRSPTTATRSTGTSRACRASATRKCTSTLGNLYGAGFQDNHLGYVFPITDTQAAVAVVAAGGTGRGRPRLRREHGQPRLRVPLRARSSPSALVGRYLDASTDLDGVALHAVDRHDVRPGRALRAQRAAVVRRDAQGRDRAHRDAQGRPEREDRRSRVHGRRGVQAAELARRSRPTSTTSSTWAAEWWYRSLFARPGRRAEGPRVDAGRRGRGRPVVDGRVGALEDPAVRLRARHAVVPAGVRPLHRGGRVQPEPLDASASRRRRSTRSTPRRASATPRIRWAA